jgi:hypothetical protein
MTTYYLTKHPPPHSVTLNYIFLFPLTYFISMAIKDKLHRLCYLWANHAVRMVLDEWAFSVLFGCVNVALGVAVLAVWLAEQEKKKKAIKEGEKRGEETAWKELEERRIKVCDIISFLL